MMLLIFSHAMILLEAVLLLAFYGLFFSSKFTPKMMRIAIVLTASVLMFSIDIIDIFSRHFFGKNIIITFIWSLCFCALISKFLYHCGMVQSFAVAALYYAVILSVQYLERCILSVFNQAMLKDYGWPYLLLWFVTLFFFVIIYFFCRKYITRRKAVATRYSYYICLLCAAALALSCLLWAQTESLQTAASGSLQILFVTFTFVLLYRFEHLRRVDEEIHLSQLHSRLMEQNLDEMERIQRLNAFKRHDFLNHISTIKIAAAQNDWKTVSDYLKALDNDLPTPPIIANTENRTANAIINSKYVRALEEKVMFSVDAQIPSSVTIRPPDLCVILGNLLDNAIDACMTVQEPEKRKILVKISTKNDFLVIRISNSVQENPLLQNPRLLSTKSESGHGIGLICVKTTIEAYQGCIEHYYKDGFFHALLTLCFTASQDERALQL